MFSVLQEASLFLHRPSVSGMAFLQHGCIVYTKDIEIEDGVFFWILELSIFVNFNFRFEINELDVKYLESEQ